jgi:sec-independent protein translocase protein TatB
MFDIGWSEMLIIGAVALIVIGPKELPGALKTFAYWMKQARKMAREFHSGVDDMIRQAELDEAKKAVEDARRKLSKDIENAVDPTGEIKQTLSDTAVKAPTPGVPLSPPAGVSNAAAAPAVSTASAAGPPPATEKSA